MSCRIELHSVSASIAKVLNALGSPTLMATLANFLCELVPLDDVLALVYRRSNTPELTYAFDTSATSRVNTGRYLQGAYLLDPFHCASMEGVGSGCYRLGELAPAQQAQLLRLFVLLMDLPNLLLRPGTYLI